MTGRYRLGEMVPLLVWTDNTSGTPTNPDVAPQARLYDSTGLIATQDLPRTDSGGVTGLFSLPFRLDARFTAGQQYTVVYTWLISGTMRSREESFEVIAGGHKDGAVTSLFYYERPGIRYLVHGLDSGKIKKGKNPRVS